MPTHYDSGQGEVRVKREDDTVTLIMDSVWIAEQLASQLETLGTRGDAGWRDMARLLFDATEPEDES